MKTFDPSAMPTIESVRDLRVSAGHILQTFGYEICGGDEEGWYWTLGTYESTDTLLAFDTIDQAVYAAMLDLTEAAHCLVDEALKLIESGRAQIGDIRELKAGVLAISNRPRSPQRPPAASAVQAPGSTAMEVFEGYLSFEGARIEVSFEVPVGAADAEKDHAFVSALAQQADINYVAIGSAPSNG